MADQGSLAEKFVPRPESAILVSQHRDLHTHTHALWRTNLFLLTHRVELQQKNGEGRWSRGGLRHQSCSASSMRTAENSEGGMSPLGALSGQLRLKMTVV